MANNNTYFYCNVEGDTNIGCKRSANEDWLDSFECQNGLVAVVCDGMGGHVGGKVASHLAVETIRQFLEEYSFDNPKTAIVEACNAANQAILRRTSEQPELTGMGSTCVLLIVRDGKVYIGSIGDSRIYLIRSRTIRQITKDQSYVQMLVDANQITEEEAEHHPRRNEITNALGLPNMQPATVIDDVINPEAGDCFLLCSDGLSGMVSDREIANIVSNQQGMSQLDRVNTLIDRARRNGGHDNITCQIVEFSVTPSEELSSTGFIKNHPIISIAVAVAILCALSVASYFAWKYFMKDKQSMSEFVQTMQKQDNTLVNILPDTIVFKKGRERVFEIEQNDQFGALVIRFSTTRGLDSITIKKPLQIANMTTSANDYVSMQHENLHCYIGFNNCDFTEKDFSLQFNEKDSTYVYVFKVEYPKESTETISAKATNSGTSPVKAVTKEGTVILDNTQGNQATINISHKGVTEVHLLSKEGTNSDTIVYTSYAIESGGSDKGWYSYKSDGQDCIIKIIGKNIPENEKDAIIKIPLANTESPTLYIINVKRKK